MSEPQHVARTREIAVPGVVILTKTYYASLVTVAFIAGLFLGFLIWGAS